MSSDAASLIPARVYPSSSLAEINLILFSQSCSSLETFNSRGTKRSPRAGPLLILSHMILPRSDFCRLPDRFGCFVGETEQPKTRKGTNKRKPGWGFLKASKTEGLRLHKKIKLNCIIGIISPGCDVLSSQVSRQTNKTESEMLSSCLTFKS